MDGLRKKDLGMKGISSEVISNRGEWNKKIHYTDPEIKLRKGWRNDDENIRNI